MWRRRIILFIVHRSRWRLQINLHVRLNPPGLLVARHTATKAVHTSNEFLKKNQKNPRVGIQPRQPATVTLCLQRAGRGQPELGRGLA